MNLTEWAEMQGIHKTTAHRWYRDGVLPVPARKVGRLILVTPEAGPGVGGTRAGLYARVSSRDQEADLDRQAARLAAWAAHNGSGMNRSRPKTRRLLADTAVDVIVVEHRDRLGRCNAELAEAAPHAAGHRLAVMDGSEVSDDLVPDTIEVLTSFCARLHGRRPARNRAEAALACAAQDPHTTSERP